MFNTNLESLLGELQIGATVNPPPPSQLKKPKQNYEIVEYFHRILFVRPYDETWFLKYINVRKEDLSVSAGREQSKHNFSMFCIRLDSCKHLFLPQQLL